MTTKQIAAAKAEIKKVQGIELHGTKLRIVFMYQGKRYREVTTEDVNKLGVRAAYAKRARIIDEIERGEFVFSKHFPNSKRAKQFDTFETGKQRTVSQALEMYFQISKTELAPATFKNYKSKASIHVEPQFGDRLMHTISQTELLAWRAGLVESGYNTKTVNDIFTPLRRIFAAAWADGCVDINPCERITNIKRDKDQDSGADPFTVEELTLLAACKTKRESEKNMMMFGCAMGLSISELMAMAWEDVDLERNCLHVRRALVAKEFKVPKETSRDRLLPIYPEARAWLIKQRAISELLPPIRVPVRQRDNKTMIERRFRPVWVNTKTQRHHASDFAVSERFFKAFCIKAGVRERGANQARHTFASQELTKGKAPHLVAAHLGHSSTTMLWKHYGKIIRQDIDFHNHPLIQAAGG